MTTTAPRRRGPARRYSREDVVDAAVAVVEASGFAGLTLRSVAQHLGVGPMTLYTYVAGSEELAALVVDRLIADAVRGVEWPSGWRAVLLLFARRLNALVEAHPAMVEAYGRDIVHSDESLQVTRDVLERLMADGFAPDRAASAFVGVHALVLGSAVLRPAVGKVPVDALFETFFDGLAAQVTVPTV